MKPITRIALAAVGATALLTPTAALASGNAAPADEQPRAAAAAADVKTPETGEFIVKYKDNGQGVAAASRTALAAAKSKTGIAGTEARTLATGAKLVSAPATKDPAKKAEYLKALQSDPNVEYAMVNG